MIHENYVLRNSVEPRCQCASLTPFGLGQVAYYSSRPLTDVPIAIAYNPEAHTEFVFGWRDAAGATANQRAMLEVKP